MSVYIKGITPPKRCSECQFLEGGYMDGLCHAASRWLDDDEYWTWYVYPEGDMDDSKPCNCPLIPVPDHGRLVDADALMVAYERAESSADQHGREFSFSFRSGGELCTEWWPMHLMLQEQPTIIPASKEDGE